MYCMVKDNIFAIDIQNIDNIFGIDCIYFNSMYHQEVRLSLRNQKDLDNSDYVTFNLNMPSDETILETKIYF